MTRRPALLLATALAVLASRPEPSPAQTGWELNVHGATLLGDLFPESGSSIQAGARLVHTTPWRLTVGGNFDWARTQEVVLGGTSDVSADLVLVSGEIGYAAPVSPRTDLMLAAGAGSAMVRLYDVPAGTSLLEESSGLLIPVGAGIRFRNRPEAATWAIRADLRDQVVFLDVVDPTSGEVDPEPRHNWEISAGVSLLFGGPRSTARPVVDERPAVEDRPAPPAGERPPPPAAEARERPEREDADQDGVPDRLDRCGRTSTRLAVGPTGCPIDMDRDGTPDPRDGRAPALPPVVERDAPEETPPERPRREVVDADRDGVPDAPPPADGRDEPEALRPGADRDVPDAPPPDREPARAALDTDRDGVPDPADRCVNTPAGATVDERGCPVAPLVRPAPPPEDAADEEAADEPAAEDAPPQPPAPSGEPPAPQPDEDQPAAPAGACLDARRWDRPGVTIAFDGRLWEQLGRAEPITTDNLRRVGDFDGVPIYVATAAAPPYADIWVPRCDPAGTYQLYVEEGTE
jgi:hypothetical protein